MKITPPIYLENDLFLRTVCFCEQNEGVEQVQAAARRDRVTIIRIGTFKQAFSDQGGQTRLSQFED